MELQPDGDHTADAVLAVAFFLASRKQDGYPEWDWSVPTNERPPELVSDALDGVGRVLSGVVATAEPGHAGDHLAPAASRRPARRATSRRAAGSRWSCTPTTCAPDWVSPSNRPPTSAHASATTPSQWVHWTTPGWHALVPTDDAWGDLLDASGRARGEME